jgi:hypothetical protein
METNNEKKKDVKNEKDEVRKEENIEKSSSSKVSSHFEKKHGRIHNSFGDGHEPGTIPGTGV